MLSRPELAKRMEAVQREEKFVAGVWLACFFALLFAQVSLFAWVGFEGPQWLAVAFLLELSAFVGGNVWLVLHYFRQRPARFGLLCTSCGVPLNAAACQFLFVTGRCPLCQVAILGDGGTEAAAAPDGSRDERIQRP